MLEHKGGDIPALFLALVIAGVVSYLIAQKWKSTLAKKEKIKMLVVLAAEEAARVELMSKSEYTAAAPRHHCAICLNPATTRCSRCKATRYCSGKCQIIHWRQGHRQECQQPDIHNSSTASCASSTNWEPNSTVSFSEAPELRSSEPDLWVPRTTAPAAQKLVPSNTEAPKFSALEAQQISMLKSEPIVNGEISYLKGVNMTGSVPDTTHASNDVTKSLKSCDHLSMCSSAATSPTKDAPMYDIPLCKSSGTDVPISCSASPSILLSSDISGSRDTIADIPLTQILVPDSLTNLINGIPRSKLSKTDISSSESHTHGGSKRFEHDLQSSVKPIHDLPSSGSQTFDFPVCTSLDVTSSNSKSPVCCLSATKGVLFHFTGSKNHAVDESRIRTVVPDIPNDGAVPDASSCRSSLSDISSSESSLPNSPRLEHSVSTKSSSKSSLLINHDGPACCASKIQNPMPNEWRTGMSASTIESPRTSVSNTVRSFGASLQHPSPHRAVACVCTISCQMTDSLNAVFSNEACTNGLKRSGKKAAHLPKSSKTSKQTTVVTVNKSLSKPGKMLFPYEYFVKLFSWDDLELPPCGLINCGNSCYANVVLQCLTYTRPLAAYLLQQSHSKECRIKDWCLMCEFEHLISRVRAGESPLSPIRILSQIQNIGNHLGYGSQEDAHEFLRFVINTMQSICLDEAGGEKAVDSRMQETTFIQQIFGGYLQSKVMCMRCQHESDRYENMMDLTVEIHGNVESLEDALSQFTAPELLDGENKYKCDRCKAYVKARKQLAVHEAPNILTIALKRFQTGKFGKLNKCVTFPDVLDMTPYMSGTSDKPPLYKLYAVVVHIDMLNASFFGHYVCYVKNFQGNWYKIDDSEVKPVELDGVMSEGAYMLLYSRTSPRHLNLTIDRIIETRTTVTVNHCAHEAEQSLLLDRHDERFDVGATQLSSLDSIACATIEGSPATIGNLSQYENGRDPCGVIHMNAFGYNCDRLPLIARDGYVDSISREYSDLISSDAGSLFSGSDEASCSTDSNRDSTSTVDYAETLFGESGSVECSSTSGWAEASFGAFHSGFCLKSSPCPPQSKCFYGNDMFSLDSSFSNQWVVGNTHLGKRRLDQGFSPLPDPPPPLATDRLPVQFSNSANSDVCHPFVSSSPLVNDYSDPSSRHGNKLDCSLRNTDRNVRLLQSQNSINVPDVSETGAYVNDSRQDFAVPAKRQYIRAKSISEILEADKVCLDVPSRSYNMASNFECSFVQDTRKSCSATVHSLGFER